MSMETTRVQGNGTHRDRPLTEEEKRVVRASVEEADAVWEARLRDKEWEERRQKRALEAEDQYALPILTGGRWE